MRATPQQQRYGVYMELDRYFAGNKWPSNKDWSLAIEFFHLVSLISPIYFLLKLQLKFFWVSFSAMQPTMMVMRYDDLDFDPSSWWVNRLLAAWVWFNHHQSARRPLSATVGRVTGGKSTASRWRSVALVNNGRKCHSEGWSAVWRCSTRRLCSSLWPAPAFRIPSLAVFPPRVNPSFPSFSKRKLICGAAASPKYWTTNWREMKTLSQTTVCHAVLWSEPVPLCSSHASVRESRSLCYL